MGLVKARDVEFIVATQDEDIIDIEGSELEYSSEYDTAPEIGVPIIIGGEGLDFESLEINIDDLGSSVFFTAENTEIVMGEAITIGGSRHPITSFETETIDTPSWDSEADDTAHDQTQDTDYSPTEEEDEPDYSQQLIEGFSKGMAIDDDGESAEKWARQKNTTMMGKIDDKVRQMMDEQRLAMRDASDEQLSFISETEKQRLLSEAMQGLQTSSDPAQYEAIVQEITQYIEELSIHHRERLFQELEEQRNENIRNVEDYIENTLEQQRTAMMQEASEYIAVTVENYKKQLNDDNEFIKAANQIISQREEMLDEAYNKSLNMVQESEAEASRIMEEAYAQQDRANELVAEAEAQAEMITQEAQMEAERIISEANMESARIIEAAEQSHQEIVEAATQDGFNVGYQEGREEAIKENAQLLMETTNALNKLHAAFPQAVKQNEDKLIKLALEIARDVIQEELTIKPELCLKSVERAIVKVSDLEKVLIKVNPLDLDMILPKQEYFRNLLPDVQDFVITGHYSINRGGCLIETNSGTIDAQINTQLAVVEEVFQQIRSEYDFTDEEDMGEDTSMENEGGE